MNEKFLPLSKARQQVSVLIVGGGIVGAGTLRDLALHNIDCMLVDKKDFASQTSSKSSKMLHGGIRYLETHDFALVWEALHEKNLWSALTPHLCKEQAFYLPIYKNSLRPKWMIKLGLFLYDLLSSFENTPHQILNTKQVQEHLQGLKAQDLLGAGVYHDVYMDDVKLCLENIYDALCEKQAQAFNYVALEKIRAHKNGHIATLKDQITGEEKEVFARHIVMALGPFSDQVLAKVLPGGWRPRLLPSKGSHLWLKKEALNLKGPLLLTPQDGRVIFVMPWEKAILVGTTEVAPHENFFDVKASKAEVDYLFKALKEYFPNAQLESSDILSSFAGIRPLVKEDMEAGLGKTAREHKVIRPHPSIHVIMGGKYTTFRKMVQESVKCICHDLDKSYFSDKTIRPLRAPSAVKAFSSTQELTKEKALLALYHEGARTFEDFMMRRLGVAGPLHWEKEEDLTTFINSIESHLVKVLNYKPSDLEKFLQNKIQS